MRKEKANVFRNALEATGAGQGVVFQIAYYTPNLDERVAEFENQGKYGWSPHRRTEQVRLYPGAELDEAVFYVAHHNDLVPGFETELIQPLTTPNYIQKLHLLSGQVAHLGV